MEYKDATGVDIKEGDHIVYSTSDGRLQLGRVTKLAVSESYGSKIPTLKVQGARRDWQSGNYIKLDRMSTLSKFDNIVVLNNNLVVSMALI